jgi:hypothetical protein
VFHRQEIRPTGFDSLSFLVNKTKQNKKLFKTIFFSNVAFELVKLSQETTRPASSVVSIIFPPEFSELSFVQPSVAVKGACVHTSI